MSIYHKNSKTYSNVGIVFAATGINTIPVSSGSGGTSYTVDNKWTTAGTTNIQSTLRVNGDANFDGDITVKGRSITKTLEKIEERLAILPPPNLELERDWSELAELRQRYVELERELLEKQRVFDILKKSY
jgi:hypothetical protein